MKLLILKKVFGQQIGLSKNDVTLLSVTKKTFLAVVQCY